MDNFDIIIKDNFFDKSLIKKLKEKIPYILYKGLDNYLERDPNKHVWFSTPVEKEISLIIKNKIETILNKKFEIVLCDYTMLATVKPLVHCDKGGCTHQAIIYIKGNNNIHKGTGFYILNEENKNLELNTHIGFKENRSIIWESSAWHSPMNWAAEDKSKRFSIIIQFKTVK
tara:strand:- start:243 stop:758 length:516 start_codon:yes stop_codon:yes gene_type:complete